ncbi:MAG: hypothetical protein PHW63_07915 [Alphaproteobacteria bacterium]|nr:hypothetical protein [Alphaproteobacteria bacterium]
MATFEDLREAKGSLIRKALGGFIVVAPMDVAVPDKFVDVGGGLIDLKALGYQKLGWLTKGDGINFSRDVEQQETESFGALEPTRIDFTKDVTSAAFRCQETNKQVLEMYYNLDLSGVTADANNEFSFENEAQPATIYRRMIYIAKDGNGEDAKYIIKTMPKAIVSEVQEQAWSSESELSYGLTVKATSDDELGFSVRHSFGGPGFGALLADMGFAAPPVGP